MNAPAEKTPVIVTVTGPSGSGKTVLSHLLADEGLRPLVSTTTRAPRASEIDGRDYHFLSKERFTELLEAGAFIENIEYNNTFYGVSVEEAEKAFSQGRPAVLVAEPHGVQQIADYAHGRGWHVLRVFVDNPEDILIGRLFNRLLLDMGRGLPGPADRPHESFRPFLDRAVELSHQEVAPEVASANFGQLLNEFLSSPDVPTVASDAPAPTDIERSKRLDAAVARLANFGFERDNWVLPAHDTDRGLYEVVTPQFNQDVERQVVDEVLEKVHVLEASPADPAPARRPMRSHR